MDSILGKIQDTVTRYVEVIAQILKVDVEIVDENLVRLAGTGEYRNVINVKMADEGKVYNAVLNSGQTQIIREPGKHELCTTCTRKLNCLEKFEVCTPIKLNDKVIGVIGLICFKEEQRDYLLSNLESYLTFLEQISDLISAKAYEKKESERIIKRVNLLNEIIDKLEQGVIIFDRNGFISHVNKNAMKILKIDNSIRGRVLLTAVGNSLFDQQEYSLEINGVKFSLTGKLYKVDMDEESYDNMFIFDETKTINNWINKITSLDYNITLNNILSVSDKINKLKERVIQLSNSTSTVLITGESGTGKELFARALHNYSDRKNNSFIAINCGAIPESLLESEFFGYVKGAFTGADPKGKIGKFEMADKGTIFLDEIGDMPLYLQVKLLRVIQEKEIMRIGSNQPIKIDVRIIAATNKNLEEMIKEGHFRQDLYYRLNVIPFELPPLRERLEDIKILSVYFANKYSKLFNKNFQYIHGNVWDIFYSYNWPGNIRELENTMEYMVNIMDDDGIINKNLIPKKMLKSIEDTPFKSEADNEIMSIKEMEKLLISKALKKYGKTTEGKRLASLKLGIGIATLYRKIEEYNI